MRTLAPCDKLEPRIPGPILWSLWQCFGLFRALLGFTWVFVLRHPAQIGCTATKATRVSSHMSSSTGSMLEVSFRGTSLVPIPGCH